MDPIEAHKKLARRYAQQSRMRERVGADVAKSLKFFQEVYGPPPVRRFYATEIPDFHGEAFPGMVFATREDDLNDYRTIIYQKGAWVVHMLRILTLDLKTMSDDRFTGIMNDFYRKYEGRRASTEDFRRLVERHTNVDMGWFFDQFVYATEIPTYRVAHRAEQAADGRWKVRLRGRKACPRIS